MRTVWTGCALLALGVGLASCGSTASTSTGTTSATDPLYFTTTSLPVAYLAESYDAPVSVAGGGGPYSLRVATGSLPPGLGLRNGRLSGTPGKVGTYTFTVEASDANLSTKVQSYTLNVGELPPLALKAQLPAGEIRGETRIPVNITAPRGVRAAHMTWELPQGVSVTRVQPGESGGVLFWKMAGRTLTVDMGFKTVPRTGARVALVTVRPGGPVTLNANRFAFEARDGTGKLLTPAPGATPAPATTNSPATPATGSPSAAPGSSTGTSTPPTTTPGTPTSTGTGTPQSTPPTPPQSGGQP